ncbi:hypothetical protein BC567DRAFT_69998 [Phyllosticta citribraziliensis]
MILCFALLGVVCIFRIRITGSGFFISRDTLIISLPKTWGIRRTQGWIGLAWVWARSVYLSELRLPFFSLTSSLLSSDRHLCRDSSVSVQICRLDPHKCWYYFPPVFWVFALFLFLLWILYSLFLSLPSILVLIINTDSHRFLAFLVSMDYDIPIRFCCVLDIGESQSVCCLTTALFFALRMGHEGCNALFGSCILYKYDCD